MDRLSRTAVVHLRCFSASRGRRASESVHVPRAVWRPVSSLTSRLRLPTILGRAPPKFALNREQPIQPKAAGGSPAGRLCDAEEQRACGRARSALRPRTSSRLSERSERSSRSEFATRPQDRAPQGTPPEGWGVACEALSATRSRPRADVRTREPARAGNAPSSSMNLNADAYQLSAVAASRSRASNPEWRCVGASTAAASTSAPAASTTCRRARVIAV